MTTLLFFLNLACTGSVLFLMWICYKRQEKFYLSATTIGAISYQLAYIEIGFNVTNMIFTITCFAIVWVIIKTYSNKINDEYNKQLLEKMKADYEKFAVKPKSKKEPK
ncbi:TPA: hypothetical protein RNX31_002149 [Pasteurella multocida]|nr:hypothetical protein [Pasteurella multocida]